MVKGREGEKVEVDCSFSVYKAEVSPSLIPANYFGLRLNFDAGTPTRQHLHISIQTK